MPTQVRLPLEGTDTLYVGGILGSQAWPWPCGVKTLQGALSVSWP